MAAFSRLSVDLSAYPDLQVIYLGMRAHGLRGLATVIGFGPKIDASVAAKPEGLLLHEPVYYSLFPLHIGMRQYWRDFESLEKWTRTLPHLDWWKTFLSRSQHVSFWHETYALRGGMESVYLNMRETGDRSGFLAFAPASEAKGSMFSARRRMGREGPELPPGVAES
jgi:hypothetical protein